MRRTLAVLGAATLLAGAGATVAAATGATGTQAGSTAAATFTLLAASDRNVTVDVTTPGFSQGDQYVSAGSLRDATGADLGRFDLACTVTDTLAEGTFQCLFTLALPHGQITAQGLESAVGPRSSAAVTGGTGRYRAARGQILVRELSATRARLTVQLLP